MGDERRTEEDEREKELREAREACISNQYRNGVHMKTDGWKRWMKQICLLRRRAFYCRRAELLGELQKNAARERRDEGKHQEQRVGGGKGSR